MSGHKKKGLKVCKQQKQEPGRLWEEHSLGLQEKVRWIQPACLPFEWSSAAYWLVVHQTAGYIEAEDR